MCKFWTVWVLKESASCLDQWRENPQKLHRCSSSYCWVSQLNREYTTALILFACPLCVGLEYVITQLKSVVLAFALIDKHITVEQAVLLSRLEEEFQVWTRHIINAHTEIRKASWLCIQSPCLFLSSSLTNDLFSPPLSFPSPQIGHWGNVEWAHDVDLYELRARTAAGALFVHFSSESSTVKRKLMQD